MADKLYYNTVNKLLLSALKDCMSAKEFNAFRLVGGTALSLQLGHRLSADIDLFTEALYGSIDFNAIDMYLRSHYPYIETSKETAPGFGRSYNIGEAANLSVKLDVFYNEPYIRPAIEMDGIRMASLEDIVAMKLEVISGQGRMKDFWDLHELADRFSLTEMLALHKLRYPYSHDSKKIRDGFANFMRADNDPVPECLNGKHWEVIKMDMIDFAKGV